jgi:hypothetical protein
MVANALSGNSFSNKNLTWQAMIQMKNSCLLTGNENIMLLNTVLIINTCGEIPTSM